MANLTTRKLPQRAYVYLATTSFVAALLVSACSDGTDTPSGSAGSANKAGSGGVPSGGAGGSLSTAGTSSTAGSMSTAGTSQGGKGGSGGAAGGGGSGGSGGATGGMGGGGGSGGMACAPTDKCCDDPLKTDPGMCGCGVPDVDDDKDGVLNCKEACPFDPYKTEAGTCGCGVPDVDSDGNGTIDCATPGHFIEAEDGVLTQVDAPITPIDMGGGGAGGAGGAGAGGAGPDLPEMFTVGDDAKASKGKYLESPAGFTADGLPGPARATYTFTIPTARKYVFWVRLYTPSIQHNKLWVKVDDGTWLRLRVTTGETWYWYTFILDGQFATPIQYDFTKGDHTLVIASDDDGVKVDRFYVTPGSERPPGDTTTCMPPDSVQIGDVCMKSCGALGGTACGAVDCAGKTPLPAYDCDICCTK